MAKSILDELETTRVQPWTDQYRDSWNNPAKNEQVLRLLWMQFINQDKAVCDGGHECDRSRLYLWQKSDCDRTNM